MAPEQGTLPLTAASWGDLFDFLDPARPGKPEPERDERATAKYLEVTRRLVCFFAGRRCRDAEDLAAETVLRVAAKCREVDASAFADCLGYFYGVARNVHHEWVRRLLKESAARDALRRELGRVPPLDVETRNGKEAAHRCLDRCLARLTGRARRLILRYYAEAGAAKIAEHRQLAEDFGKSANALRIEAHRIRTTLRACVLACVSRGLSAGRADGP